ncbi:fimbrial biogenesis chaperone [Cupriavidus pampae]|uniref:Fimbrial chaperone YadV n=1 Tax=Cupriavidus pampae TaxID=659251 RepID=A0ABM8W9S9_9BURK|nr:fimbria/pilus periplasmic chaperone [Cupriavidus pampae]CAG9163987.1 putative fimbrial chaperone YadV [Cupriavidus pampae]
MPHRFAFALRRATLALALVAGHQTAQASVVIGSTRVIYHAADAETTVRLANDGNLPALTQIWIDHGDPAASPASIDVPFVVTPPIARIDPGKGQTLRIVHAGEPLPRERESVFYLNVLEVPPKPTPGTADANLLQMAFRSRIKLFFRPTDLKGDVRDAPARLTWHAARVNGALAVEAINPTPYHVTISEISVAADNESATNEKGGMLAPGGTLRFPLHGLHGSHGSHGHARIGAGTRVRFGVINDYGGTSYIEATLSQAAAE